MAQTRTVVDIVVLKPFTNEFLEQVSFFIGALGRPKTCHFAPAPLQTISSKIQRLVPSCLTENTAPIPGVNIQTLGGCIVAPDQRFGQTVIVVDIIVAKAAFDAQTALICGTIDALNILHLAIFDLDRNLATHTTKRTNAFCFAIKIFAVPNAVTRSHSGRHQSACWTGLNAFATRHTR